MKQGMREKLNQRMDGFEHRLMLHRQEREFRLRRYRLYVRRRHGKMNRIEDAYRELKGLGIEFNEEEIFKIKRLEVKTGQTFLYGPSGNLIGYES